MILSKSFGVPSNSDINGKSTCPLSPMEIAKASLAVSTLVISTEGRIVRFVNISALLSKLPFSSMFSNEHNK